VDPTRFDRLGPPSNVDRPLAAQRGRSLLRDWGRDRSAERGRPRGDPAVFCNLQEDRS